MLQPGTLLAYRYRIEGPLGRGGTSEAYRAWDLVSDDEVALKVLRDPALEATFRSEYERLRELDHPCVVRVRELWRVGHGSGLLTFFSADLVRGEGLSAFAARTSFADARAVLGDVLEGLAVLHGLGLRHGDVKPDNVRVTEAGRGVLLDLGCAAPLGSAHADLSGTPGYLAPELLAGSAADERSDVYAFGVMLGELFRDAPKKLVARATAADPARRPASAQELLALLGDARPLERVRLSRPPRLLGRAEELARGRALCEAVGRGEAGPRVLWVHGPDGVGVSRMVRELTLAEAAQFERIDLRGADPAPVKSALGRAFGDAPATTEALLESLDELARAEQPRMLVLDDAQDLGFEARQELALAMRALPAEGRVVLVIGSHEPPPKLTAVAALELPALQLPHVITWTGDFGTEALPARLLAFTGGIPRDLERTLESLRSGLASEADLGTGGDTARLRVLSARVAGFDEEERELLSRVLVLGHAPAKGDHAELLASGLVVAERDRIVLARSSDRPYLAAALDARVLRRLHGARARELTQAREPRELAEAILHLFGAGEWARAVSLFERVEPLVERAPRAFLAALRGHEARLSPALLVVLARAARLAAEPRAALSLLARARRHIETTQLRAFLHEAAETRLALGQPARALRLLAAAADDSSRGLELSARLHARLGEHASALQFGLRALELADGPTERARAAETLALAEAYLGQSELALAHVDEAAALLREHDPRAHARCAAFRGFVLLRAGRVAEAAEAYVRTLDVATRHELLDLSVNALTNLGSTRHMQGSYGAALSFYERALRLARGLGRSVQVLKANLANLSLEIGAFSRAEAELATLSDHAVATLPLYRAELALWSGDPRGALRMLESLTLDGRDRAEAHLLSAQAELALGRLDVVERILSKITPEGDTSAIDLSLRIVCVRAELAAARGEGRMALPWLEEALTRLRGTGLDPLIARVEGLLARIAGELSAHALASEHRTRQRARLERMALDLAPSLRDAFWQHPLRRGARDEPASEPPRVGRSTLSLSRLFDINRRLTSALSVSEVLDRAMDAAIELTLAERGFVLLRQGAADIEVAAARHFGGAELKRREQKLSRSIAERVLESGESVWTVDAGTDQRFAQKASVHAMRLKSVLCVPIRHGGKVLGALYLDNRLERARFAAADAELLLAFADQVAIALHNARLVAELEAQRHELVREKRKVEELLRGKTAEVERLERALSVSRAAFETRYDYSQIVGRSEPMQKVLRVLDRVVESDVNVLVMGESGTGKELVARAIHAHGPRKSAPFVDLNCAALPEALLEAELFGHVKGAFTSADRDREGLLRTAQGGTVFLDELGEMSLAMQAKLLRVLSDREVRPVGGTRSYPLDVRFVCATNRDLEARVREGAFREDLYYRVAVVSVTLPPLRERSDDILLLADALLHKRAKDTNEPARSLAPDARRALLAHPWPGNVRELENTLVRASVMASGPLIREADLGLGAAEVRVRRTPQSRKDFETLEAQRLVAALEAERWNVSRVARALGIPRNTLYRKLERYGIRT